MGKYKRGVFVKARRNGKEGRTTTSVYREEEPM